MNDVSRSRGEPAQAIRDSAGPGINRAFQDVMNAVPGAWFFARHDGTLAYCNRGACLSLGYSLAEFKNLSVFDIDPTMTPEIWRALWETTPPPESRAVRVRHRRKDGSSFPVEVRASRVMIDGEDLAISYTIDLTDSELAERVNRRLLAAIEQTSDAVVVTNALGLVEYVNPAYERATGLREHDVRGQPWLQLEGRGDTRLAEGLARVLTEAGTWKGRIRSYRSDGEIYDEDVSLSPLRGEGSDSVSCIAVKRDVTEELRIEQQLAQSKRTEAVGLLAGGIAHDFNNLLQVILAQAELIRFSAGTAHCAPMLKDIGNAVARASNLVRQLLAFSRKGTCEFSDVRLDQLVSDAQQMLKPLFGPQIELSWQNAAGCIHVRGNAPQLEQVVVNLCINARDAMPSGGTLRLSLERVAAPPALMPAAASCDFVVLIVSDSGIGMSDEIQSRLFEPFFTTKQPGKGTGLGLATVQSIVTAHAGSIEVESRPGAGTIFRVHLPCVYASDADAHAQSEPRETQIDGAGRCVVVAEDEPGAADGSVAYLERAGFRILKAKDGVEADELLRNPAYDVRLAVLDVVMPRCSGQAVFGAMRARGQSLPVVFVTGYDYEWLTEAVNQPGIAILQKPFSGEDLLAVVAHVLQPASNRDRGTSRMLDQRPND